MNEYLMEATGENITAKDFRTWNGSCLAITSLLAMNEEEGTLKQRVAKAVQLVAEELGNKPATCRKFYIHPVVLSEYESGRLATLYDKAAPAHVAEPRPKKNSCSVCWKKAAEALNLSSEQQSVCDQRAFPVPAALVNFTSRESRRQSRR